MFRISRQWKVQSCLRATTMALISKTEVSNVLDRFLSRSIDASEAAKRITEPVEQNLSPSRVEEEETPSVIYEEMLQRVRITTHDSPLHDQLVSLLSSIKTTTSPKRGADYWGSLEPLGLDVREAWNGEEEDNTTEGWASLNSFAARLTSSALMDFDDYAIWALRDSVEDGTLAVVPKGAPSEELGPDALNRKVPAAAVWILYDGERIKSLSEKSEEGSRSTRGGPRWQGKPGYSIERWQLWKDRFGELAKREDLLAYTRDLSTQARGKMDSIDDAKV